MKRILLITLMLVSALITQSVAQSRTVTGTVTSKEDGFGMPGVNVTVKGTANGTLTDIEGAYSLNVADENAVLVFSFVGFETQEIAVGAQSTVDVVLSEALKQLTEVVVTANAIEKEKRSLGYSIAAVGGEEMNKARETNVVNSLSGKVAGVQVTNSSGTVGGSSKVLIRGAASITGSNQPLFVVDGVPISNSNISSGSRISGADTGNRAGDINPEDIESVSVLKGGAAAALYGMRAKDGVILITTKRGKKGSKGTVSVNSSTRFDSPLLLPDFQNEYASGTRKKYPTADEIAKDGLGGYSWGPKINGQDVTDWQGNPSKLIAQPDNVANFYEQGLTLINSVAFQGGNENGDFRVSYTNTDQQGIVPGSALGRNTIALNAGQTVANNLKARVGINYVNTNTQGRVIQGSNNPNVLTSIINYLPRTMDINDLKQYTNEDGSQRNIDNFTNNPYWIANENGLDNNVERVYGFGQLDYNPIEGLNVMGRVGTDFYTENRRTITRKGTTGMPEGQFYDETIQEKQLTTDLMVSYQRDLFEGLNLAITVGNNTNYRQYSYDDIMATQLEVDGLYSYGNATTTTPSNYFQEQSLIGVFGDMTLGYNNYLFLTLTGRNDWASTLPKKNQSFFYPSANLSFVFSEAFNISNDIFSYGKLRANIARVGSIPPPYQLQFSYSPQTSIWGQFSTDNAFPYMGQTAFSATNTIPNFDLEAQMQDSYEVGGEFQFFNGRLGIDATYYQIVTSKEIVRVTTPSSTGFTGQYLNAAKSTNTGLEIAVTATPVKVGDFSWDMAVNYAQNKNIVNELHPTLSELVIASAFSGIQIKAEPGQEIGIYGNSFLRDDEGNLIIDEETGLRQEGDVKRLGDLYPDWNLGVQNTLNYKGFSLSALVDMRIGGTMYSQTVQGLRSSGLVTETLENRDGTFIDQGVIVDEEGNKVRDNDVPVRGGMQSFWASYTDVAEAGIFDASFVKLREVRVGYTLPKSIIGKSMFKRVTVAFEARNLALLYSKVPHIDPETSIFGSGSAGGGIEWNNLPSTRSFGFNVGLTF